MDKYELAEKNSLKDVLDSFIDSYAERDRGREFSGWLGDKLQQEIPNMSKETGERLADEIIGAIAAYDKTLDELNAAIDNGKSKEEWFAERLAETYDDMPVDVVGERLQEIENGLVISNMQLMQEVDGVQIEGEETDIIDVVPVEWNEYSVKNKAYEIGNQFILTGMAVAANVIKERVQGDGTGDISGIVKDTLQNGLIKDSGEVKAVVAGAVKAASVKGIEKIVPEDTPTDMICDMAGTAVESAGALLDVAGGKSTMMEAMDKIGRASVAEGCRYAGDMLEGCLEAVPCIGPALVDLAGGLIDHIKDSQFAENVYTVVHNATVAAWEGVKRSCVGRVFGKIKNMLFS